MRRHAKHLAIEIHSRAIEHAQEYSFGKLRRQSRNAKVDMATGDIFLNASVLRQSSLGDVHIRHHFDARDDREREMSGRRRHFIERAVYPITDLEFVFERLEMNVARAVLR